jgi:hypothetical protein
MFSSTVLDVAIGMVFCYASLALITSSIYEAIASQLSFRSKTLFAGIQNLLNANNPEDHSLILGVYNHALACPFGAGVAKKIEDLKYKPSYMDSKHFALALIDTIQPAAAGFEQLGEQIKTIQNEQIRQMLTTMYDSSQGKIENLQTALANWFDNGMDRLSGSYKRQAQRWCFVIAFALAAIFNIDSFHLFKTLWQHPALITELSVNQSAEFAINALETLPIGWQLDHSLADDWRSVLASPNVIAGWLVTASSSLFGGPFWFDMLKKLINLRGTGLKPKQLADKQGASEQ